MAQDQAGIELILSAPDVKPIMDQVIDDWKEINRQEKLATEQLEKFNEETAKQQLRMKEIALGNQNIKDAIKARGDEEKRLAADQDARIDKQLFDQEHTQKGIFGTIKAYFQQRGELKKLGTEIDGVNKQLRNLQLRQEAISLSARRGNTVAIKEYAANEVAIKKLNGSLNTLIERENAVGAKFELTRGKLSGLTTAFNIVKTGAIAAAASVALIAVAAFAVIVALGKMNDQVKNQFAKSKENFSKARQELSDALAPVAFTIGDILTKAGAQLTAFFQDNSEAIFKWSVALAGRVAFVAAYIGAAIPFIGNAVAKLTKDIQISFEVLRLIADPTALFTGSLDKIQELLDKKNALIDSTPINPIDAGNKAEEEAIARLEKLGQAFFKVRNLTDEQRKAIEKLREEYKRLVADINKQIEALDIKEAGPFAGVLLKADLAAREIEKQGELAVDVARKLGKNQQEILKIRESVARLSQAVRDDAVKFLTDQSDTIIGNIQNKLEELRAARTGTSEDLKFKNDIEAQKKEIAIFQQITSTLIEDALNKGAATEVINKLIGDLQMANDLAAALANNTALDFFSKKAVDKIKAEEEAAKESLKNLEDIGARLNKTLDEVIQAGDVSGVKDISLRIKVNDIDIAVATEQIRQFENAFEIFKKTGVLGVVETEAQIKVRISGGAEAGIAGIQPKKASKDGPGATRTAGRSFFTEGKELEESLDLAVGLNQIAFDTITSIALSSVDAQIEALDRLNEARAESVNFLQHELDREAQFKLNNLANDYDITKKQLDGAIKLQEEGAKKQEELNKKRARIQQQQNDAQTASSLFNAVANIINGWSTVPIVGSILGIAAAAAMLVSFAATKAQANKLARAYTGSSRAGETFGMLAPGEGYDDSPGRDRGLSVVDSRGRLRGFLGGDENINKQSVSRKHRGALDYLNKNEHKFDNVNLLAMLKALESGPAIKTFDIPDMSAIPSINLARISAKNEKLRSRMVVVSQGITKSDLKEAVREVMKEHAQTMVDYHESRPTIVPTDHLKDYTAFTSKSSKRFKKG